MQGNGMFAEAVVCRLLVRMNIDKEKISEEAWARILEDSRAMIDKGFTFDAADLTLKEQEKELERTITLYIQQFP